MRRFFTPASLGPVLLFAIAVSTSGVRLSGQAPTPGLVAIRNATVLTVTKGTIPNGTVLIRDGKIAAVGTNVAIPPGAQIVDASGKFLSPGIIDCHSHIANDAINEGTVAVSSMVGMQDVLNPTDPDIYRDLAGGTTSANILHGSANPIGGKTLVIKLRWGVGNPNDLIFQGALPGIKFALGENVTDKRGQTRTPPVRFPTTREGVDYVMRDAFTRAKAYQKAWQDYDKAKAAGQDVLAPKRDLQLDPLVEILEGKRLVHIHSYRADEILMMIRVADEMGFKIATFQHVLEGYKVAKEIAAHGAGGSTFSDWWGYKMEAADAIPYNATLMMRKGVVVSINSDDAEQARRLNIEAAKAVRYGGATDDEALAMVTINPAKQLRIDNRVGSIEVGKDADLVIWNHHPLSTAAIVEQSYIDGIVYYDRVKDLQHAADVQREKGLTPPAPPTAPTTVSATMPAAPVDPFRTKTNATGGTWAITNAHIFPVSGSPIAKGTIVIKGNTIEAVGANVSAPSGAKVVDAAGASVYPGVIDAGTDIGLNEPGVRNYDDVSEILPFDQALRTRVAYRADSEAIPVTRVEGITTVVSRPGGSFLNGQLPVMNLDGWTWEEATLRPSAGLMMVFPGGGGGRGGGGGGGGFAGGGAVANGPDRLAQLTDLLARARAYAAEGPGRATDLTLEPFLPVLTREQAMFVTANGEAAIRNAVTWAEKNNVRIVLYTNQDAQLAAGFLAEHHVPVILSTIFTLPQREDDFHAYPYMTPGILAKAGVRFAFSSGGYEFSRDVPFQAGRAVAWGLDHDAAIRALTLDAARILGVDSQVGSIEAGKLANLIVLDGDPLEIRSHIQHVVIAGHDVSLDSRQTELYKRYMARQ